MFSLGFDLFLEYHGLNAGGISGLSMIIVKLTGFGTVGLLTALINLPLFAIGGLKIGKEFFFLSLFGMAANSGFIDLFQLIPKPVLDPLVSALYGGVVCGLSLGIVFSTGGSTGGSDIIVRLLKMGWQNVPIGVINMFFDGMVAVLTGVVYMDIQNALYSGIAIFVCGKIIDAVVYSFDYSKVVLIITAQYGEIAKAVGEKLGRGTTYLYGEGAYTGKETKVVLTAIKRQQLAELKEVVTDIDPSAFIIVQEAHQVLGDGFSRYSKNEL
jgi:uncharacterized membrane-anchored protein YitT (DUF2179 family)